MNKVLVGLAFSMLLPILVGFVQEVEAGPANFDLIISKSDNIDPIVSGQELIYTITVNIFGPGPASGVVVTDTLPAGVTFVETSGCNNDPGSVPISCNLGFFPVFSSKMFTVKVTVDPGTSGIITNQATVTSIEADANPLSNIVFEETTVNALNLVDGTLIPIDQTSLILAGTQLTASWLIPVIVSAAGIGLVLARRK